MRLEGQCHCGAARLVYELPLRLEEIQPRACACSYCRRHAARWHSAPGARLDIIAADEALLRYRFGTATADFCLCAHCGVLLAAVGGDPDRLQAVVNLNCFLLDGLPEAQVTDFDGESLEARLERRASRWIPEVQFRAR